MGTGTAVSTGDTLTAAKMNLKQEDSRDIATVGLLDNDGAGTNEVLFNINETNTADRTLNLKLNNANRTLNLGGDLTLAASLTTTTGAITLAANGAGSSVTLPASGTLATLAGSEQFTNKTIASGTLSGTFTCAATVVNFTTGSITFTTGNLTISGAGYISIGANPASAGYFRISNAQYLVARNAAAGADVNMIQVSANNYVKLGTGSIEIATANVVTLTFSNPAAARVITFADPLGDDSVVYLAANQTLTTKTLTSPTINGATLSGTLSGAVTLSGSTITLTGTVLSFTAGAAYTLGTTDAWGLYIKTAGVARWFFAAASANLTAQSAAVIAGPANTATMLSFGDATTKMIDLDSRNTASGVVGVTLTGAPPTIVSAAGTTWSSVSIPTVAVTLSGGVGVTALNGVSLNIVAPTITSGAATTVATASTVYISNSPQGAGLGPVTVTTGYALHVAAGTTQLQATNVAGVLTLTNATFNITAGGAATLGTTDANVLNIKTNATNRWQFASASANLTAASAADIQMPNTTAAALRITNVAGTLIFGFDSRTAVDNLIVTTLTAPAPTFASAAGSTYNVMKHTTISVTLTGGTGVTAASGLQLYLDAPTLTSANATTVALASTLYVAAPVAAGAGPVTITAGYSGHFASKIRVDGDINLAAGAVDLVLKADTAASWEIYDATTKILAIDTRVTTDSIVGITITGPAVQVAAAAGTTYSTTKLAARTHTLTGNTGVTAMSGLQLYLDVPTITSAGTPAVALASTLYVAAPAAAGTATITAGYSGHFASAIRVDGNLSMANAAYDILMKADTAVALEISDGTNKLIAFSSQVTTDSIVAMTITGPAVTVASANGSTYSAVSIAARTHTFTGGVQVTAMNGLQLNLGAPTVTSANATTVVLASTLYVAAPVAAGGGPASFTDSYAGHFAGAVRIDGNLSLANAAYDILVKANTAACLEIYDATTKLLTVNDQTGADNVVGFTFTGSPTSFASAAGSTYSVAKLAVHTATLTGGTGVTAMSGLGLYIDTPTITSAAATVVTLASNLYVAAPAAAGVGPASFTAAYSAHFASAIRVDGNLSMANAGYDLVIKADTAAAFEIYDSATKLLTIDSRTTTDNVEVHTWTAPAPTLVSANGTTWIHHSLAAVTVTLTGGVAVTAADGLQMYLAAPTLTSADATTVTTASTLYVVAPVAAGGGPVAITNGWSINASGAMRLDGNLSMANAAYDLIVKANTAAALEISDATLKYLTIDTRTATDNITAFALDASDPTYASANGSTWRLLTLNALTVNFTGGVQVTAMNGISLYVTQPILAAGQATTVVTASTLYLTPPGIGANIAITNNYIINTSVAGCFLTAAGVWTDTSSITQKTQVKDVSLKAIPELLDQIRVVTYKRKDASDGGFKRFGVIAEEAPDFLVGDSTRKGIPAGYVSGFTLAAIKWLQEEKDALEKRVAQLEAQLQNA